MKFTYKHDCNYSWIARMDRRKWLESLFTKLSRGGFYDMNHKRSKQAMNRFNFTGIRQ